jgi:dihydroorotate dehydrogenase (NAD+) catalytic subunit
MFKQDLIFRKPVMNAAGMLGFSPDLRAPVPWDDFGAFVTNPLSLRPRKPANSPASIEYPGGFLLHTGLPNPGLYAVINKHARRWADSPIPVILNLMADRPEEAKLMVKALEGIENVTAVELGFAPLLSDDIILLALEMCLGELPLIVSLAAEQVLNLGPRAMQMGAVAVSLAVPRGRLPFMPDPSPETGEDFISGRMFGPAIFPRSLEVVHSAARLGLVIIGAGGVYTMENVEAMLGAGALWVQMDAGLWLPKI